MSYEHNRQAARKENYMYITLVAHDNQEAQLSLTNRAMPVCKVVEVLQHFLSEYVDKKFTRDYNVILYLSIFNSF